MASAAALRGACNARHLVKRGADGRPFAPRVAARRDSRAVAAAAAPPLAASCTLKAPQSLGPGALGLSRLKVSDCGSRRAAGACRPPGRRKIPAVECSDAGGGGDGKEGLADGLFQKLGFGGRSRESATRTRASKDPITVLELESRPAALPPETSPAPPRPSYNGVFLLCLVNLALFAADHLLKFPGVKYLYLFHGAPRWYQFLTATFCHASWAHLSSNIFFVYIFGKLLEEEEGLVGLWATYFVTGVGSNLLSYLLLPHSAVSMGASGAVFGLFVVSVLVKLSFNWRKILEVIILGQFVVEKVLAEAAASTFANGAISQGINHVAHLGGALLGVCLICLLNQVASKLEDKKAG